MMKHPFEDKAYVKNAADQEQVSSAAEKVKRINSQREDDLRFVLSSREGRRFFFSLIEYCGAFTDPRGSDTHETYRNIGQANVGRMLFSRMSEAAPEAWDIRRKEEKEEL